MFRQAHEPGRMELSDFAAPGVEIRLLSGSSGALQVTFVLNEPELTLVLRGDVAAMLWFAASKENPGLLSEAGVLGALLLRGLLVAGTGFEPVTFRL
jgi:hypothetical protein